MEKNSGLHLLYKRLGETPNECILRFKKDNPDYSDMPMTYAGRLDPMAEGLLLVLSGEKLQEKDKYLDLHKTYEFEILWGFETDTLDVLGLVSSEKDKVPTELEVKKVLEESKGNVEQKYPAYSSKPVLGKPLFQWAREGKLSEIEMPSHEVEVFDSSFISRQSILARELLEKIESKVSSVSGDFRQEKILNKWKEVLSSNLEKQYTIDKISVTTSSGFYVRQFTEDTAITLGTLGIAFHIKRTVVGEYNLANIVE